MSEDKTMDSEMASDTSHSSLSIEKRQVADSFGRAACSYDKVAHFQRAVGQRLMALIPEGSYHSTVDLGCGTGYFTPALKAGYNVNQMIGIDLSEGMVAYARKHRGDGEIIWSVGDAEQLPLQDQSIDLIFSSLAIQWCSSYQGLFNELYRVLKPGGLIAFSTLLDGTLHELEAAWRQVDNYRHVNPFAACNDVVSAAEGAGFKVLTQDQYTEVLRYDSVQELTRELKMLGAHNVNDGRPLKVTGRERIRQFKRAYEAQRNRDGWLPASYEVLLGVLRKPEN